VRALRVQRRPRDFYPPESAEALARTLLWDTGGLSAAEDGAPHTYMPIHI
jgi:hypothetical protein